MPVSTVSLCSRRGIERVLFGKDDVKKWPLSHLLADEKFPQYVT